MPRDATPRDATSRDAMPRDATPRENRPLPRAAVLQAPHRLVVVPRPAAPLRPREVRVRVRHAAVCGTDLAIWSGAYPVPLPLVPGHEWSGEVVEIGPGVERAWAGRRVVGEINRHCAAEGHAEVCPMCEMHLPTHCTRRTVTGIVRADGAFQDEMVLPAGTLVGVPDGIDLLQAVFVEPLAAALQTFALTPLRPDDVVVVLGAGRLGVLVALAAQTMGVRVLAVARADGTLERARGVGLEVARADVPERRRPDDPLAAAASELRDRVLDLTRGRGADVVVEATGSPAGLASALDLVRPRGTIALKSTPGTPLDGFDLTRAVVHEVRLQGSRCGSLPDALEFLARHPLPVAALSSGRFPLERVDDAFTRALAGGKVLLDVS